MLGSGIRCMRGATPIRYRSKICSEEGVILRHVHKDRFIYSMVLVVLLSVWMGNRFGHYGWDLLEWGTTGVGVYLFLFSKWIWKWPILRDWFVRYPDLTGTWTGKLHS